LAVAGASSIVAIDTFAKWVDPEEVAGALSFTAATRPKVKPLVPVGLERMGLNPDAGRPFGVTNSAVYHLSPDGLYLDTVPAPASPAEVVPSVP
jgi:hypothetical protein